MEPPRTGQSVADEIQARFEAASRQAAIQQKGAWIKAILVIVFLIFVVFGGLYLWGRHLVLSEGPSASSILESDELSPTLELQNDSDELDAIESDLESTDLGGIDQDFDAIETEYGR